MGSVFSTAVSKALLSLKTVPNWNQSLHVIGVTIGWEKDVGVVTHNMESVVVEWKCSKQVDI